jgi:hypothetical protein
MTSNDCANCMGREVCGGAFRSATRVAVGGTGSTLRRFISH